MMCTSDSCICSMKVARCPTDPLSFTNKAAVNENDFDSNVKYIKVNTNSGPHYVFTVCVDSKVARGTIGFSKPQREWAKLSVNQDIEVEQCNASECLCLIVVEVDFYDEKKLTTMEAYDTDQMAKEFLVQFSGMAFSCGQQLVFQFQNKKLLSLTVKSLEAADLNAIKAGGESKSRPMELGRCLANTIIRFEKAERSGINLIGKSKGKVLQQSIISPDWDFNKIGIGGLDKEFNAIFRRAFASRVFPSELMEQIGCKHVKGILLHGPPGNGKTLMARQIGKMLNAREPKIVNGPQILDKYIGESEANAEEEEKRAGPNSGLHIIIFDEIDAICKARGTVGGNTGVHDTVVNQLLAKIDGVEQLNNILIIGMTNRKDMIDEALLRPGRLEVQMEIGLPNEKGRYQILQIHSALMYENKKISADVNLEELAALTKNFSGAEIEGLVRAAQSTAMSRLIKASNKVEVDPEATKKFIIEKRDFLHALEHDIKPAFGAAAEQLEHCLAGGIIVWGEPVSSILTDGDLLIKQTEAAETSGLVSVLIEGPPNSGKTALAAELANRSNFPFVKVCTSEDMVGFSESAKCSSIRKVFDDAYKSQLSCILVDDIERLLDYGPIGPRYSNLTLQALLVLLKKQPPKGKKLLVLCTSSRRQVLEDMEMLSVFSSVLHVPNLSGVEHVKKVLEQSNVFNENEVSHIRKELCNRKIFVGIKKLLSLIDMARQVDNDFRVSTFMKKLEAEAVL